MLLWHCQSSGVILSTSATQAYIVSLLRKLLLARAVLRQHHRRAGEGTSAHAQLTAHINFTSGICLFLVADGHYNLRLGMFFLAPTAGWLLCMLGSDAGIAVAAIAGGDC